MIENPFSELSTDLLKLLFTSHDPMQLRLICRDMKTKIENSPEFVIHLSPDGTQHASSTFFVRFKGKISIGSRHGWDHQTGWFSSLTDAIHRGLQVDTILPLTVNSLNLSKFCSMLNDVCPSKIRMLSITLSGTLRSLSTSIPSLSMLCNVAETIELKMDVLYRRPRELLFDVVEQIKGIGGGAISLKAISIRDQGLGDVFAFKIIPAITDHPDLLAPSADVLEGWAWWEWLHCSGAGGPGATALADALSAEGAGARLGGIEALELE
uniref:F-box domain-containing protein n=1 Tax=Cryptomonas curvata TaxID=233186 RepID=A0A7S0MI62_9CRYP|mmetsp:Transcript_42611/g.89091  ORF Transcript_42611/g.89091 Transcript_42611/m.89091 type:complete len:267 (+) Transcript_42611:3-803(+)